MWHNETSLIKSPRALAVGDVQYPASIFTKWSEADLNAIGIYKVTEIKPSITDTQKYGNAILDIVAHTYTHPVVDIPQEVLDRKAQEAAVAYITAVKTEAGRRILSFLPEWKQRNLTARMTELLEIGKANWTIEQQEEVDTMKAIWKQVKVIRKLSDTLEATPVDNPNDYNNWPEFTWSDAEVELSEEVVPE